MCSFWLSSIAVWLIQLVVANVHCLLEFTYIWILMNRGHQKNAGGYEAEMSFFFSKIIMLLQDN